MLALSVSPRVSTPGSTDLTVAPAVALRLPPAGDGSTSVDIRGSQRSGQTAGHDRMDRLRHPSGNMPQARLSLGWAAHGPCAAS